MTLDNAKKGAGSKAATFIESGMIVGLGSGSTAAFFIHALIQRVKKEGLQIQTVASSSHSAALAKEGGLVLLDLNDVARVDITVDGADEIDPQKRMIKGGGGAHVREKILAAASGEMVVIVDETKLVPQLGRAKVPVEILPYGSRATLRNIEGLGYKGDWRRGPNGALFVTDNGNHLFDIHLPSPTAHPEKIDAAIAPIPGVVSTGFFFGLAGRVVVGYKDGSVYRE